MKVNFMATIKVTGIGIMIALVTGAIGVLAVNPKLQTWENKLENSEKVSQGNPLHLDIPGDSIEEKLEPSVADNINLSAKIAIMKNGVILGSFFSIVSGDNISISDLLQEKPEKESPIQALLMFSGINIRRLSNGNYSMNYRIGLQAPFFIFQGDPLVVNSYQYVDMGSASSICVELGRTVCLFDDNTYKAEMTIDSMPAISTASKPSEEKAESRANKINLSVKIDIEKNGVSIGCLFSPVSQYKVKFSENLQEEKKSSSAPQTLFSFSGSDIRKLPSGAYSMDYRTSFEIPFNRRSCYVGTVSSVNVILGESVCLFDDGVYKINMTMEIAK